jgi:hypothetical protein
MSQSDKEKQDHNDATDSIIGTIIDISDDEYHAAGTLMWLAISMIAPDHGKIEALKYLQFCIDEEMKCLFRDPEETLH